MSELQLYHKSLQKNFKTISICLAHDSEDWQFGLKSIGWFFWFLLGFSGGPDGKEFAYNAGDPDSIPGSGTPLEKKE